MQGAINAAAYLDELQQAGLLQSELTVCPASPGEVASLLGWNRGRNKAENDKHRSAKERRENEGMSAKNRERYRGKD